MSQRKKHPNKEIDNAIKYAKNLGWTLKETGKSAHAWGRLICPEHTREGHMLSVWSTPRSAIAHASQIIRYVDKCHHRVGEKNEKK